MNGAVDLERAGIAHLTYLDLLEEHDAEVVQQYGRTLLAGSHNPASGVSEAQSIAYLGLNYFDLVKQHGEDAAKARYEEHACAAFLPIHCMKTLFAKAQPDVLVTTSCPRTEQAARHVAKDQDIPVLVIADTPDPYNRLGLNAVQCDILCVPSILGQEKWGQKSWVQFDTAVVTRNPALDRFAPDIIKRAAFALERHVILFAQQTGKMADNAIKWAEFTQDDYAAHFDLWAQIATQFDAAGKVRLHPSIQRSVFEAWQDRTQSALELDLEPNVGNSLAHSSILVRNFSSILQEALIVGTPVVQYVYETHLRPLDGLLDAGVTWPATFLDAESVANAVNGALSDTRKNQDHFAGFARMQPIPPSTPRVGAEIIRLL